MRAAIVIAPVGVRLHQQQRELVAAVAEHQSSWRAAGDEQLAHLLEQRAAHQVPVGVVDALEVIQVEEDQRQRVVEAL